MKLRSLLSLLLTGCTTFGGAFPAKVVQKADDGRITLQVFTGSKLDQLYDENFKAGAEKVCGSQGYDVLEKERVPSTLRSAKMLLDSSAYYWVIRCN